MYHKSYVYTDNSQNKPYSKVIEDALYNHFKQANDDDKYMHVRLPDDFVNYYRIFIEWA